jgi:vacuolar protein sorting-associated protein 26
MDFLSILGLGSLCTVDFVFDNQDVRKNTLVQTEKGPMKLLVYSSEEPIKGEIRMNVKPGKKIEHKGIKVELIGQIEVVYDRGNHHDFLSLTQDLSSSAGVISENCVFPFDFVSTEKSHESYNGVNVRLRYFLRFTISRGLSANVTKEQDIWVINYVSPPEVNSSIKMEVGIEECLHIEFEYGRSKYHLKDVILGKVYFLLVRIKIKYMEIALVKRESTGSAPNVYTETETLTKYEIMDGAPVRGESIPVRLFLGAFDLTPTYKNICNKFSVKYLLNLVLVDEEDRRYFKQTDINLWRKRDIEPQKLITVKDAQEVLSEGKKERRKKRKEKKKGQEDTTTNPEKEEKDSSEGEEEKVEKKE